MKKTTILLLLALLAVASCQQNEVPTLSGGECTLQFESVRVASRTGNAGAYIDPELAVDVLDAGDNLLLQYAPGTVPAKVSLSPGTYTIKAYSPNADTWHTANDGRGEAYYYATTTVVLQEDFISRVEMAVPMQNYAVGLQLPQQFAELFPSYTFTIVTGGNSVTLTDGQKAFFAPSDDGFSYTLGATNADGSSFSSTPIVYSDVEANHCYMVCYEYEHNVPTSEVRRIE